MEQQRLAIRIRSSKSYPAGTHSTHTVGCWPRDPDCSAALNC
jgi:hypothetical protein